MAAILDFWFDTTRQRSVGGPNNSQPIPLPPFTQGNVYTFRVRALQQGPGFPNSDPLYLPISTAGKTIQLAVGTKRGNSKTNYVTQFTWSAGTDLSDPFWFADVSFNTTEINNLIGADASADAFLGINLIVDGEPQTICSMPCTIEASIVDNTTPEPLAGLTPVSLETALALFLQRVIKGRVTFVNDTDETKRRDVFVDTDGSFHEDLS